MSKIRYIDSAVYDKVIAERAIRNFFNEKQSYELADKHVDTMHTVTEKEIEISLFHSFMRAFCLDNRAASN